MFAQLSVVVSGGPKTLVVPAAALMSAEGRDFVFVETSGGFRRADVLVGAKNDQYVEIKRGLSPGVRVGLRAATGSSSSATTGTCAPRAARGRRS